MVQNCVVRDCSSSWCPGGDIRFHAFPKNSTQRKMWLSIVPLKSKFYESARICNLHFIETDYDSTTKRLKPSAVPTGTVKHETVSPVKIRLPERSVENNSPLSQTTEDTSDEEMTLLPETSVENNSPLLQTTEDASDEETVVYEVISPDKPVAHKSIQTKQMTTARELVLRKRIKILAQKLRRQKKTMLAMKSIIATLTKKSSESENYDVSENSVYVIVA